MTKFQCCPKSLYCLRRLSYFGVVLVTLSMTSLIVLMENSIRARTVRSHITSSFWILPSVTSQLKAFPPVIPQRWAIFIPKGYTTTTNCLHCHHEDDESILSSVNNWRDGLTGDAVTGKLLNKMARLLFIIQHGATGILITSDLSSVNQTMSRLILDNQPEGVVGMEYAGRDVTTDAFHFHYKAGIVEGNPCKYYRLRRSMKLQWTVGIRCKSIKGEGETEDDSQSMLYTDPHAPPVFSSKPKFSIESFSDAFFDYEGFWALFASFFPAGSKTRLWTLWAQRMLQELNGEMALTSLQCPMHSSDVTLASLQPSNMVKSMQSFIANWKCGHEMKFYECALLLATDLSNADFIENKNVKLLKMWFKSLRHSGYPEPQRTFFKSRLDDSFPGCVVYSPAPILPPVSNEYNDSTDGNMTQHYMFPSVYPLCKNIPKRPDVVDPFALHTITKPSRVRDIALVIIFYDSSIYSNIRLLHDIYSHYFPYLIYCGPDWKLFQTFYKTFQKPLTYIEVPDTKGFVAYECISRAMMMNYDVNGYLEMADDVILNTWTLGRIPRDKFWFQKDLKLASRHQQIMHDFALPYPFPWWPWTVHGQMWGSKAMAKVWNKFDYVLQSSNDTRPKQIVKAFLDTLKHNSGNSENFFYCSSDIFYVPNKFRQEWVWLSEIFFSSNVFLDIAVPTLMNGMDWTGNIVRMEGTYLWYNNRGNYPAYYRDFHQFFHPWKMGWIHRQDHANFLCYHVLPHIVTDRTDATVVKTDANN